MPSHDTIVVYVDPELEELIPQFLANQQKTLATLQAALGREDYETIRKVGHSLKGSAGGYGFDAVTDMGSAIEEAAKIGKYDEIAAWLTSLAQYLERVEVVYA